MKSTNEFVLEKDQDVEAMMFGWAPQWLIDFVVNLLLVVGLFAWFAVCGALFIYATPFWGVLWMAGGVAGLMTWVQNW